MKYSLRDCQKMAELYPEDFFRPADAELDAVQTGTRVKLIFEDPRNTCPPERLWVQVLIRSDTLLKGEIMNKPFCLSAVKLGDIVSFETRHICDIWNRS